MKKRSEMAKRKNVLLKRWYQKKEAFVPPVVNDRYIFLPYESGYPRDQVAAASSFILPCIHWRPVHGESLTKAVPEK
jgi:hypothetical protein